MTEDDYLARFKFTSADIKHLMKDGKDEFDRSKAADGGLNLSKILLKKENMAFREEDYEIEDVEDLEQVDINMDTDMFTVSGYPYRRIGDEGKVEDVTDLMYSADG